MSLVAPSRISVFGAGAWGTALAGLAAANDLEVKLWARRAEEAARLNRERSHPALPGITLSPAISATGEIAEAAVADALVLAVPAQAMRDLCVALADLVKTPLPAVIAAKGMEQASGQLMHEVVGEALATASPLILSGPGFAAEIASGLPAAVTLAAASEELGARVARMFARPAFRPYLSDDLVGVAMGGAVKNVLAIAAGIVVGRGLGESARAGLIARGLAELSRFGMALGARRATFAGLSGLGDLVLTATSGKSRNMALGRALGEGRELEELMAPGAPLAEGCHSAPAVVRRAREEGVDMPICEAVADVLAGASSIDEAIASLLDRPLKPE